MTWTSRSLRFAARRNPPSTPGPLSRPRRCVTGRRNCWPPRQRGRSSGSPGTRRCRFWPSGSSSWPTRSSGSAPSSASTASTRKTRQPDLRPGSASRAEADGRAGVRSPAGEGGRGGDQHALERQHVVAGGQGQGGRVERVADRAGRGRGQRGDQVAVDRELNWVAGEEPAVGDGGRGARRDDLRGGLDAVLELAEREGGLSPGAELFAGRYGGEHQSRDEHARVERAPAAGDVEAGGSGEARHENLPGLRVGHRVVPAHYVGDAGARAERGEHAGRDRGEG